MATSSFTTELKFDTEEKISSFLEAIENAKNNKPLDVDVEYELIKGNDIKKFFEEFKFEEASFIQNKIKEVFTNLKCENLRIMWQSLYNLKILISALPKEMREKEKQIVISYFLILFIQKSMAEIDEQTQISQVLNIYEHYFNIILKVELEIPLFF